LNASGEPGGNAYGPTLHTFQYACAESDPKLAIRLPKRIQRAAGKLIQSAARPMSPRERVWASRRTSCVATALDRGVIRS
jgi:hypothetical protein